MESKINIVNNTNFDYTVDSLKEFEESNVNELTFFLEEPNGEDVIGLDIKPSGSNHGAILTMFLRKEQALFLADAIKSFFK